MQVIYQDKDERSNSRRTDVVDIVIYTGKIGRCMEKEHHGRFRKGVTKL